MRDFTNDAGMIAHGLIGPALKQLHLENVFTVNDFRALAERSGIVPTDRAAMVGWALHAGCKNGLSTRSTCCCRNSNTWYENS